MDAAYGENLMHYANASESGLAWMLERFALGEPALREFLVDCIEVVRARPELPSMECDLDRQYEALEYVLCRTGDAGESLSRACRGGDRIGEASGVQGFPHRLIEAEEVPSIATALRGVDAQALRLVFRRVAHEMHGEAVYKATPPEYLDPEAMKEWEDQLAELFLSLRTFFERVEALGVAVFTSTD